MEKDVFEIVLRIKGGSDYSTFEIDAETDVNELESILCDALDKFFVLEDAPK